MKRAILIGFMSMGLILAGAIGSNALLNGSATDDAGSVDKGQEFITINQAKEKALTKVDGQVESVELEYEDGKNSYEVDIIKDGFKYEVYVNAITNEILKVERDDDDDDRSKDDQAETSSVSGGSTTLSPEEAAKIAINRVGGTIREIELDDDSVYEIELNTDQGKTEVKIDAISGKIVEIEHEGYDD